MSKPHQNIRPPFDQEIVDVADYVLAKPAFSQEAFDTARLCLMDSLGCAFLALQYPACRKLLGPIVTHMQIVNGARVPGTDYELDPVQAAFNFGAMIRWLDFNDTWLAAEWGHPSDNLGGILVVADYFSRQRLIEGKAPLLMRDVLIAMIKAHEIQGIIALENSFNRVGLDHVVLVKLATAAVVTHMLGGTKEQICNALSLVWVDGQSLRTYRHAPNTGSRKSWAAGDATARGVFLALLAMRGEMGYPSVLTAKQWGFYAVIFAGKQFNLPHKYAEYVMTNILFKISFPAEFHAQTAAECAIKLHEQVKDCLDKIAKITIRTQESAVRIIDKTGPLHNPADRDHCIQYITAVGLIFGELNSDHYEEKTAQDPRIDSLREKMLVTKDKQFSRDYLDPEKRSIANAVQVFFQDGSSTEEVVIEYPIGHRRRRKEGIPLLEKKFKANLLTQFSQQQSDEIFKLCDDQKKLERMPVNEFMNKLAKEK